MTQPKQKVLHDFAKPNRKSSHRLRGEAKKTFFIKYGPPASGKSNIVNKVAAECGVESWVVNDVDAMLDAVPGYVDFRTKCTTQKERQDLYWYTRRDLRVDDLSTGVVTTSLNKGYSVAYETTGSTMAWTVREIDRARRMGYRIVVLYPLVKVQTLIDRARIREKKTQQTAAPPKKIAHDALSAAKNVGRLFDEGFIDDLYLFDNNAAKGEELEVARLELIYEYTLENKLDPKSRFAQTPTREYTFVSPGVVLQSRCDCRYVDAAKPRSLSVMKENAEIYEVLNKFLSEKCAHRCRHTTHQRRKRGGGAKTMKGTGADMDAVGADMDAAGADMDAAGAGKPRVVSASAGSAAARHK